VPRKSKQRCGSTQITQLNIEFCARSLQSAGEKTFSNAPSDNKNNKLIFLGRTFITLDVASILSKSYKIFSQKLIAQVQPGTRGIFTSLFNWRNFLLWIPFLQTHLEGLLNLSKNTLMV